MAVWFLKFTDISALHMRVVRNFLIEHLYRHEDRGKLKIYVDRGSKTGNE